MKPDPSQWSTAAWRESAVSWLDEGLHRAGIRRTGAVTQPHLRPWATVLHAPTTSGPVWLKASGPETAFEVPLYQLLQRVTPDRVLAPLAIDVDRSWVVLPDGGAPLGERLDDVDLVAALVRVLPEYGQLQRDLAPHLGSLLSFGVADMRAAIMPQRFDEAVAAVETYVDRHGGPADRETLRRAAAMRDTFAGWCERLAGAAVPPSIDHNDLHPWNVFVADGAGDGRVRFYDWGDGVVAHPFASMLLGLGYLRHHLGVDTDDPAVVRPRDAYLEVFSDVASHADLVEELELACQVGKVARALTWDRAVRAEGYDKAGDFADAPLRCLESLLAGSWLTAT